MKMPVVLLLGSLFLLPASLFAQPESPPEFVTAWGGIGTGPGEFEGISNLAVDSQGNVYATDNLRDHINVFDNSGNFLMAWGDSGCANGEMAQPIGICIDAMDNVYVASWLLFEEEVSDSCEARIQKFTSAGTFLARWSEYGPGLGEIDGPFGLAVDADGYVYVTEFNVNNRVQKFAPDGTPDLTWGGSESIIPVLSNPVGIAVTPGGELIVTDWGPSYQHRVLSFTNTGGLIYQYAQGSGSANGQFTQPCGVAVDGNGDIYVTDRGNDRVQKFAPEGTLLTVWGTTGSGPGEFEGPWDVAVDDFGNVFVSDESHRIQKFQRATTGVPESTSLATVTAFPNPFAGHRLVVLWTESGIPLLLPEQTRVSVLDVAGRLVRTLIPDASGGSIRAIWDGRDNRGRDAVPGVYFLRLSGVPDAEVVRVVRTP